LQERPRLGLTQRVFGDIGGVEPNAQGKYESGERTPKADYLAAVAARGADVLYILTGVHTPTPLGHLSQVEERVLVCYRVLQQEDQDALHRLVTTLATQSAAIASKVRPAAVVS
jgi:transcriptional regulator with XRE-family HTH domain